MSFDFGLADANLCMPRKYRWLFKITNISADGLNALPPSKGARPSLSFKESEAQHLNEVTYFPGKPEWKAINLTLYEVIKQGLSHPVMKWLQLAYDPMTGAYSPSCDGFKQPQAILELYDGCGNTIQTWTFENVWPQAAEFGELDMSVSEVLFCEMTLRYDRAYINGTSPPAARGGRNTGGNTGNTGITSVQNGGGGGITSVQNGGNIITGGSLGSSF